ncbi:MAG: cellulase family glycosylhydrolase, partial [Planctomycetales bacterium]|nr:cellulase family glycosylhydrolase [Planctomycetales bacterium]
DGRLLEDYWVDQWKTVEDDFAEMRALGANVARVHLQLGKFMDAADRPRKDSLDRLAKLLRLAEREGVYLDVTGLGCYHKQDVPAWYDELDEPARWRAQAAFWEAVAARCADSPAVFCYDLMNEPVVPGGAKPQENWLGPAFGDKHFVQFISRDLAGRQRSDVAKAWIEQLVAAVRRQDERHLITVGLVPWSLDRQGLTSGFVPERVAGPLDFVAVHLYPEAKKSADALATLRGFNVGKPVVVEETFPLRCSPEDLEAFIADADKNSAGWISFYWGRTIDEHADPKSIGEAITRDWLVRFRRLSPMNSGADGVSDSSR